MPAVSSSNIRSLEYDDERGGVICEFLSGATYFYEGVPKSLYQEWLGSDSPGGFLHRRIKPNFPASEE
jgi:hypothetical protein